jgi:hypothetical protein
MRRALQQLEQVAIADQITFSIIATDTGGAAVFGWMDKSEICEQFVTSLNTLSDAELPHALVRFAFSSFENVFFSPKWWGALGHTAKLAIQKRAASMMDLEEDTDSHSLEDDGIRAVSWRVASRETNIPGVS